jgi:hypothetical protein
MVAERRAWIIGGVGLFGTAVGWIVAPTQFPHAWLAALTCWVGWPLGSIALVLIHALTGGRWGRAIRQQLATGIATLPLVLPALLPLLFVQHALYPWMRPEVAAHLDNRFYLNPPFFYARGIVYLSSWLGLGFLVLRALRHKNPEPVLGRMAPLGLIVLALTITFSAIDCTLSLEPQFKSSIYGLLVGSEVVLLALSVAVMGTVFAARDSRSNGAEDGEGRRGRERGETGESGESGADLGRLLFGLLVFWAYLDFMQLLIVWNSNLPDEAPWYVRRLIGGWAIIAVIVAGLHFILPFFALIFPRVQRSRAAVGWLAALLVLIEVPRAWWMVIPAGGRNLSVLDVTAMMAVLGPAAGIALRARRRAALPGAVLHA